MQLVKKTKKLRNGPISLQKNQKNSKNQKFKIWIKVTKQTPPKSPILIPKTFFEISKTQKGLQKLPNVKKSIQPYIGVLFFSFFFFISVTNCPTPQKSNKECSNVIDQENKKVVEGSN